MLKMKLVVLIKIKLILITFDQENAKQNEIIKESVSETIKVENEKHSETIKESIKEKHYNQ